MKVETSPLLRRTFAGLIDGVLCGFIFVIFAFSFKIFPFVKLPEQKWNLFDHIIEILNHYWYSIVGSFIFYLIIFFLFGLLFEIFFGRTPGKVITFLKIIDTEGFPPGLTRIFLRNLFKIFEFFILFSGFFIAGVNYSRRTLHDFLSKTLVVKSRI